MTSPEKLENLLEADLDRLFGELADDESSTELYRALTNNRWGRRDGPDGHVVMSWARAAALVNGLRERHGKQPLDLPQTGGEGEVSTRIAERLRRDGWTPQPLNTGRADDARLGRPEGDPGTAGGYRVPADPEPPRWEREAHAEAEANRR